MKKLILLLTLLLVGGVSYAQDTLPTLYSHTVSSPYKVFDGGKYYFCKGNEILAVKMGEQLSLQKFEISEKIKFRSQKLYEYEDIFPKNHMLEAILEFDGRYYIFYSSWDKPNYKEQVFAREIDFNKGELVSENKLVFRVEGKVLAVPFGDTDETSSATTPGINMYSGYNFDFLLSGDKKKLVIKYRRRPKDKDELKTGDIIGMNAFEGGLEQKYTVDVKMPYGIHKMDVLDYTIDSHGNSYMIIKVTDDVEKKKSDNKAKYHLELFKIAAGSNKIEIYKIDIRDKFVKRFWINDTPYGYMVCAGFYSDDTEAMTVNGMTTFKVNNNGIYEQAFIDIPLEIINQNLKASQREKNEKKEKDEDNVGAGMRELKVSKIIANSDGSTVLIGESEYITSSTSQKGVSYVYHYGSILVTKIDAGGKLLWMKKIPKIQGGINGRGSMSYKHFLANGHHYLLYMDNKKNIGLPYDERPAAHRDGFGGYFTSFKIDDKTGNTISGPVINTYGTDNMTLHQFYVSRIFQISPDEFGIEFYKKDKEDVMFKVKML